MDRQLDFESIKHIWDEYGEIDHEEIDYVFLLAGKAEKENQQYKEVIEELKKYINSIDFYDNCWDVGVINEILDRVLKGDV